MAVSIVHDGMGKTCPRYDCKKCKKTLYKSHPFSSMMIPFPHDVVGHWMSKHDVKLSNEAYHELNQTILFYNNRAGGGDMPVPEFLKVDELKA